MGFAINTVAISGNLTADPEVKAFTSGSTVANFRIAHNESRKNNNGGYDEVTHYFNVTMWGKVGESIASQCRKGMPVTFSGQLAFREWQDKEGNKRQSVEIVARDATVGMSKAQRDQLGLGGGSQQGYGGGYNQGGQYGGYAPHGGYGAPPPPQQGYQQGGGYGYPAAPPPAPGYVGGQQAPPPPPSYQQPTVEQQRAQGPPPPSAQRGLPDPGEDDIPF